MTACTGLTVSYNDFQFDPSCEAMIFSEDGSPLQGITGGNDERRRVDFPLKRELRGKVVVLYAEISCNGLFGVESDQSGDPDPNRYFTLASADIVVKRPQAWKLLWDWTVLRSCVNEMPKDGVLQNKALWVCNQIMSTFRKSDLSSIDRCRKIAEQVFGENWEDQGAKLYDEDDSDAKAPSKSALLWSLGHTHIDTAWLWPFSATQQKVARSWSTQLDLMERYPEFKFTASTAQQYIWLEELYPDLFERIKKQVDAGRFVPIGGTWVENDANMPSGEAFVRQFLYGQRYFKSRFGKNCDIFWLPDSFGYNAQIPQLARSAGCEYWFTQKLSWSNVDSGPATQAAKTYPSTFVWVGIDGTQLITHMTPVDNYDSHCDVDDIRKGVWNNRNLNVQPAALHLFGWGDGGGGPSAPMLEKLRRERATHNNGYTEMPKVVVGKTAREFYDHVLEITDQGNRLPTWYGELYLEFHRAVQTSHGSIKKWNRKLEVLLHNLEWVATLASLQADSSYTYPKADIDALWEPFLKCQFHDVLPGSSIRLVYNDAEQIYVDVNRKARSLLRKATAALGETIQGQTLPVNTLAIPRRELVSMSLEGRAVSEVHALQQCAVQLSQDGNRALTLLEDVNGSGVFSYCPSPAVVMKDLEAVSLTEHSNGEYTIRNAFLSLKVSHGRITSLYDIAADREIIAEGRSAGLVICEDYPNQFDAWDTDIWSLDTLEEIRFDRARVTERGPWRTSLELEATFGKSWAKLHLSVDAVPATVVGSAARRDAGRSLVRIDAEIEWQEKHRFLRFEVPTGLRAETASFETQFGITQRPTTRNTSWEAAKFEVCGHKFSDLSEPGYGLSILNDCKYGHSAEGSTLRLSLLKGATYPDAHQDEGRHTFAFALYPHHGTLAQSDVVTAARIFNNPVEEPELAQIWRKNDTERVQPSMPFILEQDAKRSIVLDTLKRGEEDFDYYKTKAKAGSKTVVVRLYEALGCHAEATLKIQLPGNATVKSVEAASILEDELPSWELNVVPKFDDEGLVDLQFRPFEVKTLKIRLD